MNKISKIAINLIDISELFTILLLILNISILFIDMNIIYIFLTIH